MKKTFLVGLLALSFASTASAQDDMAMSTSGGSGDNSIANGAQSFSFSVPGGGNGYADGAAGVWMMLSDNMNLGLNVGLGFANKPDTTYNILLAPAVRMYSSTDGNVLPYIHGQANLLLPDPGDLQLSAEGGLGVEWFVTKSFSLAGHAAVGLNLLQQGGSDAGISIGTFQSVLTANIYQ
mgnify:CR=1 FL=1